MIPKHVISANDFDRKALELIFNLTDRIKAGKYDKKSLDGKIMATLFYEPSTRTRLSFETAMIRLGGRVISTENAGEFSSAAKGETLEDTIRVVDSYSDIIVLRHFKVGASERAAKYSKVPIINGGDGNGEHPTQALLDLYTIFSRLKKTDITITMVGDMLNGRTIHSLSYLLLLYKKIRLIYVSPKGLAVPKTLRNLLTGKKAYFEETEDFKKGLTEADVVYMTRIQKERFSNQNEYKKYLGKYILDKAMLKFLKRNAIIMHPLPRVNEITRDVDRDKRAIYFEQAQNGVFVRMALLMLLFDNR